MTNQDIIQEIQRIKQQAYRVFNLTPSASLAQVDAAYDRMAFTYHPDRNKEDPKAFENFKMLCEAKEIIHGGYKAFEKKALDNLMSGQTQASFEPLPKPRAASFTRAAAQSTYAKPQSPTFYQPKKINAMPARQSEEAIYFMRFMTALLNMMTSVLQFAIVAAINSRCCDSYRYDRWGPGSVTTETYTYSRTFAF